MKRRALHLRTVLHQKVTPDALEFNLNNILKGKGLCSSFTAGRNKAPNTGPQLIQVQHTEMCLFVGTHILSQQWDEAKTVLKRKVSK